MWKRIGPVAVASGLLVAGSWAAGRIAADAEYCQYGDYISVEKCGAYDVATVVVDMIAWSADTTLPLLIFFAVVAACLLSCSLHESHDTLKRFVVVRGAQRNLRFSPVDLRTSLAGPKPEVTAHDTKSARARVIASSAVLLELLGPEVVVSNSSSNKTEAGWIRRGRLRSGRI